MGSKKMMYRSCMSTITFYLIALFCAACDLLSCVYDARMAAELLFVGSELVRRDRRHRLIVFNTAGV